MKFFSYDLPYHVTQVPVCGTVFTIARLKANRIKFVETLTRRDDVSDSRRILGNKGIVGNASDALQDVAQFVRLGHRRIDAPAKRKDILDIRCV